VLRSHTPARTDIYPLSLHDALPICARERLVHGWIVAHEHAATMVGVEPEELAEAPDRLERRVTQQERHPCPRVCTGEAGHLLARSEEHTSELQSRENLVCRLLLEKK